MADFKIIETQEQFDEAIKARLERDRESYARKFEGWISPEEFEKRTGEQSILDGIANGIRNAAHFLWDAAKDAAKNALDGAKSFLGISSPSKVMRDQVGVFISEGIAEGILANEGAISNAMEDVTDLTTGSINANLAYKGRAHAATGQYSYGGFTINVYGAPGQDVQELADIVSDRINQSIRSRQAVFA